MRAGASAHTTLTRCFAARVTSTTPSWTSSTNSPPSHLSLPDLKQNYVMAGENVYGHMSAKGNALIAALIAEKLRTSVELRTIAPLNCGPRACTTATRAP